LQRVQQVIDACYESNRKIVLTGKDFSRIIKTAMKLGKLNLPDENILITQKQMRKYDDHQILILESGRMGEPIKALQRMATGSHQTLRIKEGDLVYITTTPTIAMETYVAKTEEDRKSTRLNSSHVSSSYAVFCLKKKIGIEVKLAFNYNGSNQDMQ